jgi:hypothetical protein
MKNPPAFYFFPLFEVQQEPAIDTTATMSQIPSLRKVF